MMGTQYNFASDPVAYTCEEGYSLDGSFGGDITFTVACLADKSFAEAPTCMPVKCGPAPAVAFSSVEESESSEKASSESETVSYAYTYTYEYYEMLLEQSAGIYVFPNPVKYKCDKGYTIDGLVSGSGVFTGTCTSTGLFDQIVTCEPVACPAVPPPKDTTASKSQNIVFPQVLEFNCASGFTAGPAAKERQPTFEVSCEADGKIKEPKQGCVPVDCGKMPSVDNTDSVKGSTLFGGSISAKAKLGYTLDGTAIGADTFEIKCQKDGKFTEVKEYQRVSCGEPPVQANAAKGVVGKPSGSAASGYTYAYTYTYYTSLLEVDETNASELLLANATSEPERRLLANATAFHRRTSFEKRGTSRCLGTQLPTNATRVTRLMQQQMGKQSLSMFAEPPASWRLWELSRACP
jgi:hypothetical protein